MVDHSMIDQGLDNEVKLGTASISTKLFFHLLSVLPYERLCLKKQSCESVCIVCMQ